MVNRQKAAYMPARSVQRYIDTGRLFPVPDAPRFPYPVWAVWRDDVDPNIASTAKECLSAIVDQVKSEQNEILDRLVESSEADEIGQLGKS
jgi:DNA-binding transcriptional LysR family regulator